MSTEEIIKYLPTSLKEMENLGWKDLDVILFSGDAYVDHPSFGTAVIARIMEAEGLKIAIVPQPNWKDDLRDFKKFGKPNLFFAVSSGCMDSMINHYTAAKKRRSNDAYTAGGKMGLRPDYASTIYSQILKKLFPDVPVILGGIEASLRRVTHYDYWQNKLKPSILIDSQADLLVYGMGEKPLKEIIRLLQRGVPFSSLNTIPQTAFILDRNIESELDLPKNKKWNSKILNSHSECLESKQEFAENFKVLEINSNILKAQRLYQKIGNQTLVINPSYPVMSEKEIDSSFDLPYTRMPHPRYKNKGSIPAYEMIKFSINLHRGCFGGCSFCTISAHQGKFIVSRSAKSIQKEAHELSSLPNFKGTITDMGGPSANMYKMQGRDLSICEPCKKPSCIFPVVCPNLDTDHSSLLKIYKIIRSLPKVKHAFVTSGIRYDLFLHNTIHSNKKNKTKQKFLQAKRTTVLKKNFKNKFDTSHSEYFEELVKHHVSGRLKVAPEHNSNYVLNLMRKPSFEYFKILVKLFKKINTQVNKKQEIIPYFISAHPGCHEENMAELAAESKQMNYKLKQVQDFTPTPMTLSAVMHYSGIHPYTKEKVRAVFSKQEKERQKKYFFWYLSINKAWIKRALTNMKRSDLWNILK